MKLTSHNTVGRNTIEVYGDEYSENVLLIKDQVMSYYHEGFLTLVFVIYTTGYGGETGIEYLGQFIYHDLIKVIEETEHTIHLDEALEKLERLDKED